MTIPEWVRYRLTGEKNDSPNKPTDAQLQPLIDSFLRKAKKIAPCVFTAGELNLTGDDLQDFNEWVGRSISAEYAASPAGKALIDLFYGNSGKVKKKEADGVSYEYSTGPAQGVVTADSVIAEDLILSQDAKNRIACIAEANQRRQSPSLFRVASRRAAITAQCRSNRGY